MTLIFNIFLKSLISLPLLTLIATGAPAVAHQPVSLLPTDTSPATGPLLVDGRISFALRANFSGAGQVRAFRVGFAAGDQLSLQYLIVDEKPENKLKIKNLPELTLRYPSGKTVKLKLDERTEFFEPFSNTRYLYLARLSASAEEGIHTITVKSKVKAKITIGVGDREELGEVIRN